MMSTWIFFTTIIMSSQESTSAEADANLTTRSRHQSEHQEPQSTSSLSSLSETNTSGSAVQKWVNASSENVRRGNFDE